MVGRIDGFHSAFEVLRGADPTTRVFGRGHGWFECVSLTWLTEQIVILWTVSFWTNFRFDDSIIFPYRSFASPLSIFLLKLLPICRRCEILDGFRNINSAIYSCIKRFTKFEICFDFLKFVIFFDIRCSSIKISNRVSSLCLFRYLNC